MYIWEHPHWPQLFWDEARLSPALADAARKQGYLFGQMGALGFELNSEAQLQTLTLDVIKTSEIEGELLAPAEVRSSLARQLGIDQAGLVPSDRTVDGVVEVMLDATTHFAEPLTTDRLMSWHRSLFPSEQTGLHRILVGAWRDDRLGPMQVVSGPIGREKVHYQAPEALRIPEEMDAFLQWFEHPGSIDSILYAGLAHFWFITIHPFEDGNGRIARAIADMALARGEMTARRFYSMSAQICRERSAYYEMLEERQKGDLDITAWQEWFIQCVQGALNHSEGALRAILFKARFWERFATEPLNERQIKVINKLLDGFEGKLTTTKWARLAKCSQDTAYRDILDLVDRGALQKNPGGGRSTSYSVTE